MSDPLSPDTDPRAEQVLFDLVRGRTAAEKLAAICRMWAMQVRLAEIGLRSRYPDAGPEEMRKRLCAVMHGRAIARQVFGWDPDREGY
ncbi:MAG: hypothetical protein ACM3ZC_16220 [Bacteroidota bacterium]